MKRNKLKKILETHYHSVNTIKSIMSGRRKPSYKILCILNDKNKIPFTAWKDIKTFLTTNESLAVKDKKLKNTKRIISTKEKTC